MTSSHESLQQLLRDKNWCASCWAIFGVQPPHIAKIGLCDGCGKTGVLLGATDPDARQDRKRLAIRDSEYWQEGRRKFGWVSLTIVLLVLYGVGIGSAVFSGLRLSTLSPSVRTIIVLVGFTVSVVPTFFWWRQTWHFETWVRENPLNLSPDALQFERDRFKTNSELARAFWTALVFVFVGLLVTSTR
jgi:hypothetical protein